MTMLAHPLSSILLLTLATFLAVLVIPGARPGVIKWVSALGAFGTLLLCVYAWANYDIAAGGFQFNELYPWMPTLGVEWRLGVDGFSLPLLTLNAIVFFTGVLSMWELKLRVKEYFALMILLVLGVSGVFMALDLFAFFFFYEVAVLPMYLLIAVWGSGPREYAAMKLTLYLMAGSALLFPALLAIYFQAGLGTCDLERLASVQFDPHFQIFVYPFLYVGFGVLAGMWPFHNWSPSGHSAAPTAVSMLHAGVLMKLGAFGILAVAMRLLPDGARAWAGFFAATAAINIIYGAFVALRQADLKFVVGFSSVSHMGIVLLGLNLAFMAGDRVNALNGAVLQMFCHGAMTALFFSTIGYIYDRTHTKLIAEWGGMARTLPRAATFFILAGLCGIGLPGLASFWAELLVFLAALRTMPVLGVLVIAGLVITAIYMLRVFETAFFGPARERWASLEGTDMKGFALLPRAILAGVLIAFGFAPQWILGMINSASTTFLK